MSESLGKCRICGKESAVVYPLLPGAPAFCSNHHNPKDSGPFGCDFTCPDDFDMPEVWYSEAQIYHREEGPFDVVRWDFIWTDINKQRHRLRDIDDRYLQNIINFIKRKLADIPDIEYAPKIGITDTERETSRIENLIEFLEKEQKFRDNTLV